MAGSGLDPALAWMWDALIMATSFQHWPDGDPDGWRALGDAWLELSDTITDSFNEMNASANNVALAWGGDAGQAFISRWAEFVSSDESGPAAFAVAAYNYYDACYNGALQLEYSQLMCEIILTITAIEVAIGLAFAEFGGAGFSAAAIAAGRIALREVLEKLATAMGRQILKTMLKDALKLAAKQTAKQALKGAVKGGLTFGFADLLAQQIQVDEGHRDKIDWASVGVSTASGAAAGASGVVFGKVIGLGGRMLAPAAERWLGRGVRPLLRGPGKWVFGTTGRMIGAGLVNVPTMAVLDLTQNAIVNHSFGFSDHYLGQFKKNGVVGELWNQFAAGAFAAGVHATVTGTAHGLISTGRWVGGKISLGAPELASGGWLTDAKGLTGTRAEGLINSSTSLTQAETYRQLEIKARQEANGLTGANRRTALNDAHTYESLARQADQRTADALRDTQRPAEPAFAGLPVAEAGGSRSGSIRIPEPRREESAGAVPDTGKAERKALTAGVAAEATDRGPADGGPTGPPQRTGISSASHEPALPASGEPSTSATGRGGAATTGVVDRGPSESRHLAVGPENPDAHVLTVTGSGGTGGGTGGSHLVPDLDARDRGPAGTSADATPAARPSASNGGTHPRAGESSSDAGTSLSAALDELGQAHQGYVVADLQAAHARQELEQARQTATGMELDGLRKGRPETGRRPDLSDHQQDSEVWGDLATASRGEVLRRLDGLLNRPDLPESARPQLERMRTAYRDVTSAHTAADVESSRVAQDRGAALDARGRGDREAAVTSAQRSGEAAGREARLRIDARRSLATADEALRAIQEEVQRTPRDAGAPTDIRGHTDETSAGSFRVSEERVARPVPEERAARPLPDEGVVRPVSDQHTVEVAGSRHPERALAAAPEVTPSRTDVTSDRDVSAPGADDPMRPDTPAGQHGGASPPATVQEELRLSEHFGNRYRTGAQLTSDVHELVDQAKERLRARYPESSVRNRIADLDAVARQADRLDALVQRVAAGGHPRDLVAGVRELSRAVNDYADKYRDWRDFAHGGEPADAGWHDLHGVDPLDSVELAHRSMSIDPQSLRFHPLERAIAIAKIEDVLGAEFGEHAMRVFDRIVPKDPAAARALLPPHLYTPELEQWLVDPSAHGAFDPRALLIYVEPGAITAVAATAVHEGMHFLEPNTDAVMTELLGATAADRGLGPSERTRITNAATALIVFQNEHRAFTVEQRFLRGLTGFNPELGYESDLRIPVERRHLAAESPEQMQETTLRKYIDGRPRFGGVRAEQLFGTRDLFGRYPELNDAGHMLDQARTAIADSLYHGRQGGFVSPATAEAAGRWHIDLDAIRGGQSTQPPVTLRDPSSRDAGAAPGPEPHLDTGHPVEEQRRTEPSADPPALEPDAGLPHQSGSIRAALTGGGASEPVADQPRYGGGPRVPGGSVPDHEAGGRGADPAHEGWDSGRARDQDGRPVGRLAPLPREAYAPLPADHLAGDQLAQARLRVRAGVVYDAHGQRFDSRTVAPDGRVLYVMDTEGRVYVASADEYSHAGLHPEAPVAGAGHLVVHDGTLLHLDGHSRDFAPPREYVDQVVQVLARDGVDLSHKVVYPEDRPAPDTNPLAQRALDDVVDRIALTLDQRGRTGIVEGIEGLPDHRVRLLVRGSAPVEVDLSHVVNMLVERGLRDQPLNDAIAGWIDRRLEAAVTDRGVLADPGSAWERGPEPRPSTEPQFLDAVRRATDRVTTDWRVSAAGENSVVVRPPRGRDIVFRLSAHDGAEITELRSAEVAGASTVEVRVPAELLADPVRRDLLLSRALESHAVEVRNTHTGLSRVVSRMIDTLRPRQDALGPDGTGRELTIADQRKVAELRVLADAFAAAPPGRRAIIAREFLAQADTMFKRPGQHGRFIQTGLVEPRLPDVDDLLRSAERYRALEAPDLSGSFLHRVGLDNGGHDLTYDAAPPVADAVRELTSPGVSTAPPANQPIFPIETMAEGRRWISDLPADLVERAAAHDTAAIDTLVRHVEGVLRQASDPASWVDGRPPQLELRAEHGIDAQVARRLEHVRVPFDAGGERVPPPRLEVTSPRTHGYMRPMSLVPEIREQDMREGVPYFTAEERAPFQVRWHGGRAYDMDGLPLDGHYVFVTEPHTMATYAMEHATEGRLGAKHSTFLAGGEVMAAGEFKAEQGQIVRIDNRSGHYFPTVDHVWLQRELLAGHGVDTSALEIRAKGPEHTAYSTARSEAAFDAAIIELAQPGEIDRVLRIERVDDSFLAREDEGAQASGSVLRVFTTDGRAIDVDASNVLAYLRTPRSAGADAVHFDADRRVFVHDKELAWQASDWLRQRIEHELAVQPHPSPVESATPRVLPHTLVDLDRVLSVALGTEPLLDGVTRPESTPVADRAATVAAIRAVSDARIQAEVRAAGLPADRATELASSLIARRDEAIAGARELPDPQLQRDLQAATVPYVRPDMQPKHLYEMLHEEVYRKNEGLTVREAARLVDEGVAAQRGRPNTHEYEGLLDEWLRTPEGRAYHDGMVALDLATQQRAPLPAESARFRAFTEADAEAMHARQGGDWAPPIRQALGAYADRAGSRVDSYVQGVGEHDRDTRLMAYRLQAAMRPATRDGLLHSGLTPRQLGIIDLAGLPRLLGETVTVDRFLRAAVGESPHGYEQLYLEIEAPAGTRMAWLGIVRDAEGPTEMLLAAGTRLHVLDVSRVGGERYSLRVRVVGQEDPPALATRMLDGGALPGAEPHIGTGHLVEERHRGGPESDEPALGQGAGLSHQPVSIRDALTGGAASEPVAGQPLRGSGGPRQAAEAPTLRLGDEGGGAGELSARDYEQRAFDELDPDSRRGILAAVGPETRATADRVMADLQGVAGRLEHALGLEHTGERAHVGLVGSEHRVKGVGSLTRKYLDAVEDADRTGDPVPTVDDFVARTNDVIRFSLQVPEEMYSGGRVVSVLRDLGALGYRGEDGGPVDPVRGVKNFWRVGNRFYGLNVTLREPGGRLFELQFPTERSWAAGKLTHGLYEVVRQEQFSPEQRVRAFLDILRINRMAGLPDRVPVDQVGLPEAKMKGFADWIEPDVWDPFADSIRAAGKTFDDVIAEYGLSRDDFPRAERVGIFGGEDPVLLSRDFSDGGEGSAARRSDLQRGYERSYSDRVVEPLHAEVDVRQTDRGEVPLRRRVSGSDLDRVTGGGGADSSGGVRDGVAERGGVAPDLRRGGGGAGEALAPEGHPPPGSVGGQHPSGDLRVVAATENHIVMEMVPREGGEPVLAHLEKTGSGWAFHAGDDAGRELAARASAMRRQDGYVDIVAHATAEGFLVGGHVVPFHEVFDNIPLRDTDVVRLIACDAGAGEAAARLAADIGHRVVASTKPVWITKNGRVISTSPVDRDHPYPKYPPDGEWSVFDPPADTEPRSEGSPRPEAPAGWAADTAGDRADEAASPATAAPHDVVELGGFDKEAKPDLTGTSSEVNEFVKRLVVHSDRFRHIPSSLAEGTRRVLGLPRDFTVSEMDRARPEPAPPESTATDPQRPDGDADVQPPRQPDVFEELHSKLVDRPRFGIERVQVDGVQGRIQNAASVKDRVDTYRRWAAEAGYENAEDTTPKELKKFFAQEGRLGEVRARYRQEAVPKPWNSIAKFPNYGILKGFNEKYEGVIGGLYKLQARGGEEPGLREFAEAPERLQDRESGNLVFTDVEYASAMRDFVKGDASALREIARAVDEHFAERVKQERWRTTPGEIFLEHALAVRLLVYHVEPQRHPEVVFTNLAALDMAADGRMSIKDAIVYFNTMHIDGAGEVARHIDDIYLHSLNPEFEVRPSSASFGRQRLADETAEFRRRELEILVRYGLHHGLFTNEESAKRFFDLEGGDGLVALLNRIKDHMTTGPSSE